MGGGLQSLESELAMISSNPDVQARCEDVSANDRPMVTLGAEMKCVPQKKGLEVERDNQRNEGIQPWRQQEGRPNASEAEMDGGSYHEKSATVF